MNYQVSKNGGQSGPWTEEAIRQGLGDGSLLPTDLVWTEGWEQWATIESAFGPRPVAEPELPPYWVEDGMIVCVSGAELPCRCVITNEEIDPIKNPKSRRTERFYHKSNYSLVLGKVTGALGTVTGISEGGAGRVSYTLSEKPRRKLIWRKWSGFVMLFLLFPAAFLGAVYLSAYYGKGGALGWLAPVFLIWGMINFRTWRVLRAVDAGEGFLTLSGAGVPFRQAIKNERTKLLRGSSKSKKKMIIPGES